MARRAIIVAVALGLGVWVAIAAAQGGLGGASPGTGTAVAGSGFPCPAGSTTGQTTGDFCAKRPGHPGSFGPGGGGGAVPTSEEEPGGREGHARRQGRRFVGRSLTFTFSVRLRHAHGAGPASVTSYTARISPPRNAPRSCQARLVHLANLASRSQVARVRVRPPRHGWCAGHYRVSVFLHRGIG
jgi:hypothetical protein